MLYIETQYTIIIKLAHFSQFPSDDVDIHSLKGTYAHWLDSCGIGESLTTGPNTSIAEQRAAASQKQHQQLALRIAVVCRQQGAKKRRQAQVLLYRYWSITSRTRIPYRMYTCVSAPMDMYQRWSLPAGGTCSCAASSCTRAPLEVSQNPVT